MSFLAKMAYEVENSTAKYLSFYKGCKISFQKEEADSADLLIKTVVIWGYADGSVNVINLKSLLTQKIKQENYKYSRGYRAVPADCGWTEKEWLLNVFVCSSSMQLFIQSFARIPELPSVKIHSVSDLKLSDGTSTAADKNKLLDPGEGFVRNYSIISGEEADRFFRGIRMNYPNNHIGYAEQLFEENFRDYAEYLKKKGESDKVI